MSMPKRVILVQCGSFNPPHVFHLRNFELAKDYCAENGVEVVASVMSPAGDSYRAKHSLPFRTRVELCKLAAEHTDVTVDDWEGSQPTFVRTLDVLQHYYEQYHAGAVPVLICGSDLVDGFLIPNFWVKEKVIEMLQRFYIFCIERDIDVDRWKGSYFEQYLVLPLAVFQAEPRRLYLPTIGSHSFLIHCPSLALSTYMSHPQ